MKVVGMLIHGRWMDDVFLVDAIILAAHVASRCDLDLLLLPQQSRQKVC